MEKMIAREEIECLLKDIEKEMDELEKKLGKTVQYEKAQKEEHLLNCINTTMTAAEAISDTVRIRKDALHFRTESSLALNTSFYS